MTPHIAKIADAIYAHGIKNAFGVTGGGPSLELITELEERGVEYIPTAHEAAAVMMAGAVSCAGTTKAVAITIKGPGFANAIPGILSNFYEARPALTISEAFSPKAPSFRMHKRMDHKSTVSKLVKGFASADSDGKNVETLIVIAESEIPGPIHMELYGEPGEIFTAEKYDAVFSDKSLLNEIKNLISASSRPTIVLGSLASRKLKNIDWSSLTVPVVTTAAAKGAMNESSTFSAGIITGEVKELSSEDAILKNADLIVAFGLRNTEVVLAKAFPAPLINIDIIDGKLSSGFQPKINFVSEDLNAVAGEMIAFLKKKQWGGDIIKVWKEKLSEGLFQKAWMPASVFRSIKKIAPDSSLVLDTGLFCTIGETVWCAESPGKFLGSSIGRFMGTSIPTAIGLAFSAPDNHIICAMGDGGVRPYFPELKIVAEKNLPILFLFMSDEGYGSIATAWKPKGLSRNAFEIKNSEWWRAAEVLGIKSQRVENIAEFEKVAAVWQKSGKPIFLEMHFDPEAYLNMTAKLR